MDNDKKKKIKKVIIIIFFIIAIITSIVLYARFIGTTNIEINEFKIESETLSEEYNGFKIIHISDILYGTTSTEQELEELTTLVNLAKPDIIVITGDIFDSDVNYTTDEVETIEKYLNEMTATAGKYMVSGDNDKLSLNDIAANSDFIVLDDTYDTIYEYSTNYLLIAGLGDNEQDINEKMNSVNTFLETNTPCFKILIFHNPDLIEEVNTNNFDLILAGHTLGNSINIPILKNLFKKDVKYTNSYYRINTSDFYISNGIGNDKIYFRLFNHPSINLYRIVKKA